MASSSRQSIQQAETIGSQIDVSVAEASLIVSALLNGDGKAHAIIGGQAVRLLGHSRRTQDLDVLVDDEVLEIRARMVEVDNRFSITSYNKLVFKASNNTSTEIELLRGGPGLPLALPSAAGAPKLLVDTMTILHPGILIITKIKRWIHIAESTRPKSVSKALTDITDIEFLLRWLVSHDEKVNFESYAAIKPKDQLLAAFRTLYRLKRAVRDDLQRVLDAADYQCISL